MLVGGMTVLTHARPKLAFDGCEFNLRATLRAIARSIREATCGLAGHDYLREFTTNRIFLQCASCGHETPGWEIEVTNRGKGRMQHAQTNSVRPRLVRVRMAADRNGFRLGTIDADSHRNSSERHCA